MKTNVPFTSITVFSFPKNDVLRKEWITRIPRELTITKTTIICVNNNNNIYLKSNIQCT